MAEDMQNSLKPFTDSLLRDTLWGYFAYTLQHVYPKNIVTADTFHQYLRHSALPETDEARGLLLYDLHGEVRIGEDTDIGGNGHGFLHDL